jgi:hypothetical protein
MPELVSDRVAPSLAWRTRIHDDRSETLLRRGDERALEARQRLLPDFLDVERPGDVVDAI